jgi:hypothetical protein
MTIQKGDSIRFIDGDKNMFTGTVLETKPAEFGRSPTAYIRWNDGYRDSWIQQSDLEKVEV